MEEKLIAFTFDDAPAFENLEDNPTATILDVLNHFGGKATFFITGSCIRKRGRTLVDEFLKRGFEIANHTDNHATLTEIPEEAIRSEILTLQETVKRDFGVEMKYVRPAGLRTNDTVFAVTKELGMPVICGSHGDAYLADWNQNTPPDYIKKHCLDNVYPGQIILMHSYSNGTQAVFYEICEALAKDGYRFVTLSELFDAYGVKELPCDRPIEDALLTDFGG